MLAKFRHKYWIPSLYFAEGLPYMAITLVALVFYKQMGLGNAEITFYTAWLYLPWILRPLWAPFLQLAYSKRWWVSAMQLLMGAGLGGVAFTIPSPLWLQGSLFFFWATAFAAATHENMTDGLYSDAIPCRRTDLFLGCRAILRQLASMLGQGLLIMLAGNLQVIYRNSISYSWSITFYSLAGVMLALWLWNHFILPNSRQGESRFHVTAPAILWNQTLATVKSFLRGPSGYLLGLLVLYRMADGFLSKVGMLFLIDAAHNGGLGLSPQEYGFAQGTLGVLALATGGMVCCIYLKRHQNSPGLWELNATTIVPSATYIFLSYTLPDSLIVTSLCIAFAQFCLGFGTFYFIIQLIHTWDGELYFTTEHNESCPSRYTISRSILPLALMIPSLFTGFLEELVGYRAFFIIAFLVSTLIFLITSFLQIGRKA